MYTKFKRLFRVAPRIPNPVPDVTSSAETSGIFEAVSESISSAAPSPDTMAIPDVISDVVPDVTSSAVPDVISSAVPDVISNVISDVVPDVTSSAVQDVISNVIPDVIPDATPSAIPGDIFETVSNGISNAVPESISNAVPAADTMMMLTTLFQVVVVAASLVTLVRSTSSRPQKSLSVLLLALFTPSIWSLIPASPHLESLFITIGSLLATLWALMTEIWFEGSWDNISVLFSMLYQIFDAVFLQSRFFHAVLLPVLFLLVVYLTYRMISGAYDAYVDLGRGGTPTTFRGWLRVSRLKHQARLDVLQPPRVPPFMDPYRGRLYNLPQREGLRPTVMGVAPQRQVDQKASPSTFFRLSQMLRDQANANPKHVRIATSFLEGHLQALRKVVPDGTPLGRDAKGGDWEFGGEIAHPHRLDGSMHIVLHPEDVRTVIEAGWGERHPLAIATPSWKLWHWYVERNRRPVPEYLVILYAPLNAEHYRAYESIIQAAMWFATAGELYPVDVNTYPLGN